MKTYAFLLKYAMWALPLACVAMLSSCYNDEYDDCLTTSNDPVPVTVKVSAGAIGDLNGTRVGGDPNAEEHEFINTLHVYVVSHEADNVRRTLMELNTDGLADNALAQEGNLTDWTSETFTLAPGTYMFYAFANIDNYEGQYGDELSSVMGGQFLGDQFIIDDDFTDDNLNSYRLLDPAAEINFGEGKYIPMSAVDTVTVSGDLNASGGIIVDLPLERLVSKVRMTIGENAEISDYADASVTFAGYSHDVPLMAASSTSTHGERDAATPAMSLLDDDVTHTDDGYHLSFYVNETPNGDEGFTVTLNTGDTSSGGISKYMAVTNRTEIPRNRVYPLSLTFPTYSPKFEWQSWAGPIGYYAPVVVPVDKNTYTVSIAEGAQFEFAVIDMSGGTLNSAVWNVPATSAALMTDISTDNNALSAELTAGVGVGTQIPLSVKVTWTDNVGEIGERTMTRTYNVIINTVDITDVKYMSQSNVNGTRSGASGSYWLNREYLNMFKLK